MFNLEGVNINFSFDFIFFLLAVAGLIFYTVYYYKITIPPISFSNKIILTVIRSLALLFLIFAIFEPVLTLTKKNEIQSKTYVFIDNSRSIKLNNKTRNEDIVSSFWDAANKSGAAEYSKLFLFGNKTREVFFDSSKQINFSDGSTNFDDIFQTINKAKDEISSIVILSDGIITEGSSPVFSAEKLALPVFTIALGDTTEKKDVKINSVLYNEYFYSNTPSDISVSISNNKLSNKQTKLLLFEDDKLIAQYPVTLSPLGQQNVLITYTPKNSGQKKISLFVDKMKEESNYSNNKRIFFIKVKSQKIKTLIAAGNPSPDLSFIKNSLREDKNLDISQITFISSNTFLEKGNFKNKIDSAEIYFLIDFPSEETSDKVLNSIAFNIKTYNKPFFFLFSNNIDLNKFKLLQDEMPFYIKEARYGYTEVQPYLINASSAIIPASTEGNDKTVWNDMPPVYQTNSVLISKPGSIVLLTSKIKNVQTNFPLVLFRNISSNRSIAILAKDIWRWKLQSGSNQKYLFDRFFHNVVKFLSNTDETKPVKAKSSKQFYSAGEEVEIFAQVNDELLNPINNAELKGTVENNIDVKTELHFSLVGDGLYSAKTGIVKPGNYYFNVEAFTNSKLLGKSNGRFNVGEIDIEALDLEMNYNLLYNLAAKTNGEMYYKSNFNLLFDKLKNLNRKNIKHEIKRTEIPLWSNKIIMILIIVLFAVEWYLRKKLGLL